jgi:hypothetical protein
MCLPNHCCQSFGENWGWLIRKLSICSLKPCRSMRCSSVCVISKSRRQKAAVGGLGATSPKKSLLSRLCRERKRNLKGLAPFQSRSHRDPLSRFSEKGVFATRQQALQDARVGGFKGEILTPTNAFVCIERGAATVIIIFFARLLFRVIGHPWGVTIRAIQNPIEETFDFATHRKRLPGLENGLYLLN